MRYILSLILVLTFGVSIGQVYNPTPQYVYRGKLGAGRSTAVDSAAYFQVGPNGGANAGVILPRVADTLSISGTKRNGLLIFSNQLNKFAWWDSTGAKWTEVGSGSATSGEVLLLNGSGTVGDSLLFSSISGDTAYVRNLWFANGLVVENMGDTVLKVNIDSSTVANIYNSDGKIPTSIDREILMLPSSSITIGDSANLDASGSYFSLKLDKSSARLRAGADKYGRVEVYDSVFALGNTGDLGTVQIESSTSALDISRNGGGHSQQITFDNYGIRITTDSILQLEGEVIVYNTHVQRPVLGGTGNITIDKAYTTYVLQDLTSTASSRTVTMGIYTTTDLANGTEIRIINQNDDATYKWTFAGMTVYDKDGTTVTNITDKTSYALVYLNSGSSSFGAGWHIVNKY